MFFTNLMILKAVGYPVKLGSGVGAACEFLQNNVPMIPSRIWSPAICVITFLQAFASGHYVTKMYKFYPLLVLFEGSPYLVLDLLHLVLSCIWTPLIQSNVFFFVTYFWASFTRFMCVRKRCILRVSWKCNSKLKLLHI